MHKVETQQARLERDGGAAFGWRGRHGSQMNFLIMSKAQNSSATSSRLTELSFLNLSKALKARNKSRVDLRTPETPKKFIYKTPTPLPQNENLKIPFRDWKHRCSQ